MLENIDIVSLVLLITGGAVAFFGFFKVIRQGLTLLPWLALVVAGIWGVSYGWEHLSDPIQSAVSEELPERVQSSVSEETTEYLNLWNVKSNLQEWCNNI